MDITVQLEGVLFYKAAPMKKAALAKLLGASDGEIETGLQTLAKRLEAGATRLLLTDTEAELVTAAELDELIESIRKDDLKRDIGKAGAETLAIILYRGPVTRSDIDRIRGVNSSFILRNLLVRGLIERSGDGRAVQYKVTPALLAHLGVSEKSALPGYEEVMNTLDVYERNLETESA